MFVVCVFAAAPLMAQCAAADPPAAVGAASYTPLTGCRRLHLFLGNLVSPVSILASATSAGIGQWRDRPEAWTQGAEGYGKRFGSSFAEHLLQETMLLGSSSALHEDNRYLRSGESGSGRRLKYALSSAFLARRDDGSRRFSYSRIGSMAGAAFVSRTWQPPGSDGVGSAALNFAASLGVTAGFDVAREFLPRWAFLARWK